MNYNVKVYDLALAREFLKRDVLLQAFESYDGGGSCGYIVEFQRKEDLEAFCQELEPGRTPRCWIEQDDGRIEDITI